MLKMKVNGERKTLLNNLIIDVKMLLNDARNTDRAEQMRERNTTGGIFRARAHIALVYL